MVTSKVKYVPAPTGQLRQIKAKHFFDSAFKEFSLYDNVRSIPLLFDGMKPSQRKALYGVQLRGENANEIQVERLAAQVAAATDYHHGTGSMEGTIIGMANNYAGSNNMNFFEPSGQFGSRLTPDAASARYIFTKFSPNFRKMFKKEDDAILIHNETDGEKIEPKYYMPILPVVLINGASGTGTGHACNILSYHPEQVRDACLTYLEKEELYYGTLIPWFNGFRGTIEKNEDTGQVVQTGIIEVINSTTLRITELPVGMYLDKYREHLKSLEELGFIKDFTDKSTEESFDFEIVAPRSTTSLDEATLLQKFKLISRDTENFTMWNEEGVLERFGAPEDVVVRFVDWRIDGYETRRLKLISETTENIRWLNEKLRFILFYLDNADEFRNRKKADLVSLLTGNNFVDYDRLLAMPIWSLTRDKIEELQKQIGEAELYLKKVTSDTARKMYIRELKEFSYE